MALIALRCCRRSMALSSSLYAAKIELEFCASPLQLMFKHDTLRSASSAGSIPAPWCAAYTTVMPTSLLHFHPRQATHCSVSQPHIVTWTRSIHTTTRKSTQEQQVPTDTAGWTTGQVVNFPNTVSILRLLSGPLIAHWILQSQWNLAVPGLAIAGASDWLDGQLARRSGQSSVLGSYLDPLADKVLVGAVVAALGYTGALPLPLAGVIVGRDAFLVTGAVALRAQSLNWRWPGAREFFRIVPAADGGGQQPELGKIDDPLGSRRAPAAAFMKPLMVSKVNTGLQLVLVGACMTDAWVNWPGSEAVWVLGAATAVTTVWSCGAYVAAYVRGGVKGVAS